MPHRRRADAGEATFLLIQAGLDHIDQGITIFDDERALVAWKRVFFQMLALPETLLRRGKPFSAFRRRNAEHGGYGPGAPTAPSSSCSTTRTTPPHWWCEHWKPSPCVSSASPAAATSSPAS
jgi:hypothetical protein